jgi:hypothetical protein
MTVRLSQAVQGHFAVRVRVPCGRSYRRRVPITPEMAARLVK